MTQIGWFQLENLFLTRNLFFTLIDMRKSTKHSGDEEVERILKTATFLGEKEIDDHMRSMGVPLHHPVVFVCENGRRSTKAAERLEKQGYTQVYVLEDGEACFTSKTK